MHQQHALHDATIRDTSKDAVPNYRPTSAANFGFEENMLSCMHQYMLASEVYYAFSLASKASAFNIVVCHFLNHDLVLKVGIPVAC